MNVSSIHTKVLFVYLIKFSNCLVQYLCFLLVD